MDGSGFRHDGDKTRRKRLGGKKNKNQKQIYENGGRSAFEFHQFQAAVDECRGFYERQRRKQTFDPSYDYAAYDRAHEMYRYRNYFDPNHFNYPPHGEPHYKYFERYGPQPHHYVPPSPWFGRNQRQRPKRKNNANQEKQVLSKRQERMCITREKLALLFKDSLTSVCDENTLRISLKNKTQFYTIVPILKEWKRKDLIRSVSLPSETIIKNTSRAPRGMMIFIQFFNENDMEKFEAQQKNTFVIKRKTTDEKENLLLNENNGHLKDIKVDKVDEKMKKELKIANHDVKKESEPKVHVLQDVNQSGSDVVVKNNI